MKTALIILDGLGLSSDQETNPIFTSQTPFLDTLLTKNPYVILDAAGEAAGLPFGEPGNSEVGHYNLGTGELSWQTQELINQTIKDKSFFRNPILKTTFAYAKQNKTKIHLIGLISDGGVHSQIDHLEALLEFAKQEDLNESQVFIHGFSDGRDTQPKVATKFFNQVEKKSKQLGIGQIATICGRFYAMDRDNNWERTMPAYQAMVNGVGEQAENVTEAIGLAYERKETDEFIKPTCITNKNGQPKAVISSNDAVIIFNYRADRARQLVKLFLSNDPDLPKRNISSPLYFTTMTPYETDWKLKINVAFKPTIPNITLSDLLAQNNLSQIHIAETEKYPHVTYFFNGGNNKENILEKLIAVPSAKLSSYDQKPQMSLMEINLTLKKELSNNLAEFVLVNYANCDMVGHTGNFDAIRKAISAVDFYLKDLIAHLSNLGYKIFITADHGNAEQAINPVTKNIDKEHTINPVFFIIVNVKDTNLEQTYINHQSLWIKLASELKKGILVDVTATVASSLGIKSDLFSGQKIL